MTLARRLATAALGVPLALAPCEGHAQRAAHLSTRDISDQERARDTMTRFADCVVKARPGLTKEALAKTDFAESTLALNDLVKTECLAGGQLRMNPRIFRGALYRALYLREFGDNAETLQFAADDGSATHEPTQAFGECVVRAAPAAVRAYVVADVATPEEKQALAELAPALSGCINPTAQISFSPAMLEAILAEALYKNSVAHAHGAGAGEGVQ